MLPPVLPLQQDDGAGGEDGVYRKGHDRPQGLPDNTEQQVAGQCRQAGNHMIEAKGGGTFLPPGKITDQCPLGALDGGKRGGIGEEEGPDRGRVGV